MIGQPASLRRINQSAVIRHLLAHGPATRAQIAKAVGLSSPTVGKVASELMAADVLEQINDDSESTTNCTEIIPTASKAGRLGRPGVLLQVNQTTPRFVLLQLGVRHTRLMARPLAGPIHDEWPVQFATPKSATVMTKRLRAAIARLDIPLPWAVMVSTSGVVDEASGRVLLAPNLHWTSQVNLAELLGDIWSCPIHLVQEIRALALGQQKAMATTATPLQSTGQTETEAHQTSVLDASSAITAASTDNFLLVDIGEGVGAAAVLDGQLFASNRPFSGELGHTPVSGNTRKCGCGSIGCLETLLSRDGLLQSYMASKTKKKPAGDWSAFIASIEKHGVAPWLRQTLDAAAMIVAGAMNMLGVKHVVVTGALSELPAAVMDELSQRVAKHAMWGRFGSVVCVAAPRQRAAGLMEAAMTRVVLANEQQGDQPWETAEA